MTTARIIFLDSGLSVIAVALLCACVKSIRLHREKARRRVATRREFLKFEEFNEAQSTFFYH